ncbi:MAG: CAP domain-containing protein [Planctomycetota bacterium]|nr:CAP domain-containing protein [Planctomycetota bacterium]
MPHLSNMIFALSRRRRSRRRIDGRRCSTETLERRILLTFDPSPLEQEMLEYLNRFRDNPQAELDALLSSYPSPLTARDPDVQTALDFFNVDGATLANQFAGLNPAPPLAWNEALYNAANAHNSLMIQNDLQSHQLPGEAGLLDRIVSAGYDWQFSVRVGENVFAYSLTPAYGHAAFVIDWGFGPNGIQNPAGHRVNMLDQGFQEVGISITEESNPATDVGPLVISQEFGRRGNYGAPAVLGIVYDDLNGDGFYNAGEGLSGVNIELSGPNGTFTTSSLTAGGYQIKVPSGEYIATASGGSLGASIQQFNVSVGGSNKKVDFEVSDLPASPTHTINLADGIPHSVTVQDDGIVGNGMSQVAIDGVVTTFATPTTTIIINGGDNADTIFVTSLDSTFTGSVVIVGNDGNDVIDVSAIGLTTSLSGDGGDDILNGGSGQDFLNGGSGDDTITGSDNNDTLNGGSGRDLLDGGNGDDRISGQGSSGDILIGGPGNDRLDGGSGVDTLFEMADTDFALTSTRLTGIGTDQLISIERVALFGGNSNNRIDASLFTGPGIEGVLLLGGAGDDLLIGSPHIDQLNGSGGDDTLLGGDSRDTLRGGSGADSLNGESGNDLVVGQGGSGDSLTGGEGNDTLNGGSGSDFLIEAGDADLTLTNTTLSGIGSDSFTALEIFQITGGTSANRIDASAFSLAGATLSVNGEGGNDTIIGSSLNDVLNGGDGNDIVLGRDGNDLINGDDGDDTLNGGSGNDTLIGGAGADGLSGFTGNDVLDGKSGNDTLFGREGNDTLLGAGGDDTVIGGDGRDIQRGHGGTDVLVGGNGGNDPDPGDQLFGELSEIDEAFQFDPLPDWVDSV